MKTTINLTHKQFNTLYITMSKSLSKHGERKFDEENIGWKIIFNEDGSFEVWHGRYGVNSKELD
jgi:hypothetical protein